MKSVFLSAKAKNCIRFSSALFLAYAGCVYAETQADTPPVPFESGYWEVNTRPDFPGVPMAGSKNDKLCLTVDDIKRGHFPLRISPFCSVKGGALAGDKLELKIECPGYPDVKGGGELTLAGNTFTGKIAIPGGEGSPVPGNTTFSYFYTARRVGECPAK